MSTLNEEEKIVIINNEFVVSNVKPPKPIPTNNVAEYLSQTRDFDDENIALVWFFFGSFHFD